MFCPECGRQNPQTAKFCIDCGYNYTQTSNPIPAVSKPPSMVSQQQNSAAKSSDSPARIILLLVILGLVGFGAFQVVSQQARTNYDQQGSLVVGGNTSLEASFAPPSGSNSSSASKPQSYRIVNQAFTLKAGEFASYKFTIPKTSNGGKVTGNFTASGGSDDIFVILTNQAGVTNIKNGNSYKAYYDSGKVTMDEIDVNLAPGTYFIVFTNIHSLMTPKAVNADISVEY